ncbi:MAG TPA: Nramp family divalent metal transporter [Candidatus Acidoferrum sp.]|jgi:manganese transport protein
MGDAFSKQLATQPPLRTESASGWRNALTLPSLPEAHRTSPITQGSSWFRKILAFAGPGYLIAVGYMDPGNWATDIGGGSKFGYALLSVVLISNLMAMFLQGLSAKLGTATGRDLAQACRDHYSRGVSIFLWVVCELAIAACDLAEVLGSAIALKLLFGLPLLAGVVLTAFDVLIVLALQGRGFRLVDAFVVTLIGTIAVCFAYEIFFARASVAGSRPRLHSATGNSPQQGNVVHRDRDPRRHCDASQSLFAFQHRVDAGVRQSNPERREAIKYSIIDSTVALTFALFINAAILVLGASLANTLFAFALLASGQNSTLTGTLAGQIVMEGFLRIRLKPWIRRLITRMIAILPAVLVIGIAGEGKLTSLLILSQVILSFQLPFAVIPLVRFTSERAKMGEFVNSRLTTVISWGVTAAILFFNVELLWLTFRSS